MSSLKKLVLSTVIVAAIVACALVCLAWATGYLVSGQPGPIFCAITFVLVMTTLWATRTGPSRSKGRADGC